MLNASTYGYASKTNVTHSIYTSMHGQSFVVLLTCLYMCKGICYICCIFNNNTCYYDVDTFITSRCHAAEKVALINSLNLGPNVLLGVASFQGAKGVYIYVGGFLPPRARNRTGTPARPDPRSIRSVLLVHRALFGIAS